MAHYINTENGQLVIPQADPIIIVWDDERLKRFAQNIMWSGFEQEALRLTKEVFEGGRDNQRQASYEEGYAAAIKDAWYEVVAHNDASGSLERSFARLREKPRQRPTEADWKRLKVSR